MKSYLQYLKNKNYSPNTIETYQRIIDYYGPASLNTTNIAQFIKQLNKNHEPATCQLYVAALKSYAKFHKIINLDWERIIKPIPKIQKKFYTTINELELAKLKQVRFEEFDWKYQRNNLMLEFLFYSGLRVSELVSIKHRDWQNNTLIRVHGKGDKVRHILLPDFLTKHFRLNSRGYLFTGQGENKLTPSQLRMIIRQRVQLAGIKKWITPHTFRRSLATNLYKRGGRIETISKQLGHSNHNTTMGYIHNDFNTLYQDYSKLFQTNPSRDQSLKSYTTAQLLAEISQRAGGNYA